MAIIWICECGFTYMRDSFFYKWTCDGIIHDQLTHTQMLSAISCRTLHLLTTLHWQTWSSTVDTETKSGKAVPDRKTQRHLWTALFLQFLKLDKWWRPREREEGRGTWAERRQWDHPEAAREPPLKKVQGAQEQMPCRADWAPAFIWETPLPQRHKGQPGWG